MSSGVEPVDVVDPWLFGLLKNDPTITSQVAGRISNGAALGPSQTPFITWDMTSATDVTDHRGFTLLVECLFQIKAVGQGGSYVPVAPIARRIHELVIGDFQTARGVISCRRDRVIRYVELDDNVQFRHLGGVYRILTHSTT